MKPVKLLLATLLVTISLSSCRDEPYKAVEPTAYDKASFAKGGIMYDKFWAPEAEFDQNNQYIAKLNAKPEFFRCKQCHGWDGLGRQGSYIGRGPNANRPNISPVNLLQTINNKTPQELFDALKKTTGRRDIGFDLATYNPTTNNTEGDKMPNYNQLLTDAQMWDLVKFLKGSMFDVTKLYDATYTGTYPTGTAAYTYLGFDGNAAAGNAYYAAKCKSCHGADGKQIMLGGISLGKFMRTKPYETHHKIKYGQLGSSMGGDFNVTLAEMKNLYKATVNTTTYPD